MHMQYQAIQMLPLSCCCLICMLGASSGNYLAFACSDVELEADFIADLMKRRGAGEALMNIIFSERLHIVRAGDPESTAQLLLALQAHQVSALCRPSHPFHEGLVRP